MARLRVVWLGGILALAALWFQILTFPVNAQTPYTGFLATYYGGRSLQGTPLLTRVEPVINWTYDTGGSPIPGQVPSTDFSVRWEGWYLIDRPGTWTFTYTSDDGGRVWLDNELILDMWYDHGPLTRAKTRELAAGYHLIRVEYYQHLGGMTSQLTITPPGVFPDWMGEYFDNPYLLGEPRFRVNNVDINFNWGTGGPDPRVPPDNFSVRWTRLYTFAPGSYVFSATADDGIRVWVGDALVIDAWYPQQARTYTNTLYLSGTYPLRVEFFEQGGQAVVNFNFKAGSQPPLPPPAELWLGKYYPNPQLAPPPACALDASQISFNWGGNSPGCGIPGQFFSVRWDSNRSAPATGFYTIYVTVDDGARVFVDDSLVLDAWYEQAPSNYSTTIYLDAGVHRWRVEYFQATGGSQISVNITSGVVPPPPPPPPPSNEVIVDALGPGWTQGGNSSSWRTAPNGHGGSALWTYNNAFIQPNYNWGRWYPQLNQGRNYEVQVYIPGGIASTLNARYWIYHAGRYDLVTRPQAPFDNQWVSLGTFFFAGQGGEFVSLSDVTYEPYLSTTIVWDAVKFVPE